MTGRKRKPGADDRADTLYGLSTIALFLGITEPEARQLAGNSAISTFNIGTMVCAKKSSLRAWLAERGPYNLRDGDGP